MADGTVAVDAATNRSFAVRAWLQAAIDVLGWAVAVVLAQALRYDLAFRQIDVSATVILIGSIFVIWLMCAQVGHLYRHRYTYGSFEEARVVALSSVTCAVIAGLPVAFWGVSFGLPRSTMLIAFMIVLIWMLGVRYFRRILFEHQTQRHSLTEPAIIFGAGFVGSSLVRRLLADADSPYRPVALLDDDASKKHVRIRDVDVLGRLDDLPAIVGKTGAKVLVVAIAKADSELIQRVVEIADPLGVNVKIVPPLQHLLRGVDEPMSLRDLTVEDIIGRRPIDTDVESIAGYLKGKRVLVTGAGGSIGQELCAQIHQFEPAELIMLDRDETALQTVEMKVFGNGLLVTPEVVLVDIRDADALTAIFENRRPEVVFHAAALKHLPMLQQYPDEAWKTNVLGTLNVLRASRAVGVSTFINISTDKAADPTSVLGHSKRLAERLTAWMAQETGLKYLSVRFGNVLGSRGSMLPLFTWQIEQGGPITVTHPDVTRYFMTIPEACQLVLQAGGIGRPGEVLILDMGEQVKILDIAKRMVAMSGRDIKIEFTGLRTGEKLHEDLTSSHETAERPFHKLIAHAKVKAVSPSVLDDARWTFSSMSEVAMSVPGSEQAPPIAFVSDRA